MKMRRKTKPILQLLEKKHELICQYCDKEFKYESERKRHEQSHSPRFACKVCNKKFSFMSAMRRHEKQHERTGSVCCSQCNRKFRDDSLLKRHMKYAHKGTFTCSKCNGIFNSDLALKCHMKIHKPESERKYHCSFEGCTKSFNFPHHLKHHELTHTNTKQYFCSICDKGFIQYHHMKSHLKTHKPNSTLPCKFPNCNKTFTTNADLKKHKIDHSNTKETSGVENKNDVQSESLNVVSDLLPNSPVAKLNGSGVGSIEKSSQIHLEMNDIKMLDMYSPINKNKSSNNLCQSENEELTMLQKVNTLEINEDVPISDCKSTLGECIMGGEGNGQCLCAQIQPISIEDTYELIDNKKCYSETKLNDPVTKAKAKVSSDIKDVKMNSNCDNCGCISPVKDVKKINEYNNDMFNDIRDVIDYKYDGTVKIKEVFDINNDLESPVYSSNRIINVSNVPDNIPFNSCKAVLGTCIVSGDGTIDDGCLCAKMAIDDEQMLDQEITDLTPCPK